MNPQRAIPITDARDSERAKRALFDAMLTGYQHHLDTRNCSIEHVAGSLSFLRRVQRELGWPWEWETAAYEKWQSELSTTIVGSTRRGYQNIILSFTAYICSPIYPWVEHCKNLFDAAPRCLITEANRILHIEQSESGVGVRPATRGEIQTLFDTIDEHIKSAPRPLTTYRDGMLIKLTYAYGLRRAEAAGMIYTDFNRNVFAPEFRNCGSITVRNGKAKPRGPKRTRVIHTSQIMDWIVPEIEQYIQSVRPLYRAANADNHLFLADHGGPVTPNYVSKMFKRWCDTAGIDPVITMHSLRRSFATHHAEAGYEGAGISMQMGHEWEQSTGDYIYLTEDYVLMTFLDAQRYLGGEA
jgi:integrase